jgi:6-pyruvoyltetrahydropterin/6-carboxytetrahydropterin synthase
MAILEFTRRYAMAHRLLADPEDRCATPHGHNEFVTVRFAPSAPIAWGGDNRLAHFSAVKAHWRRWIDEAVDHAFQVNAADPLIGFFRAHEPARLPRLMVFPGDPTTEALCAAVFLKSAAFLRAAGLPFTVAEVRVEETPTNAVVLPAALFDPTAAGFAPGSWARRADLSINDF